MSIVSVFYGEPMRSRVANNEASTTSSLQTLNTAEVTFASTYNSGVSDGLYRLGAPATGQPDVNNADLVDPVLSGRAQGGTSTSFVKSGYRFVYTPGAANPDGRIRTYSITARPIEYKQSGLRSFFTDQTGAIRATAEDRAATARDATLQ